MGSGRSSRGGAMPMTDFRVETCLPRSPRRCRKFYIETRAGSISKMLLTRLGELLNLCEHTVIDLQGASIVHAHTFQR